MSEIALSPELRSRLAAQTEGALTTQQDDTLLSAIVQMARDPAVDVSKLSALLQMQERLEARQSEVAFNQAFIRLQGKLPRIRKRGVIEYPAKRGEPKQKIANYVKFDDLHEAIKPMLDAEGFVVTFKVEPRSGDGGGIIVTCLLKHTDGHTMVGASLPVPLDTSGGKNNIQGYGSALSYGKRYTLTATLNLSSEEEADDDAARGGAKFLTPEQVDEIEKLIEEAKADRAVFLQRFFEATDVANLTAEQYVPCRNMLLARIRARAPGE